MNLPSPHPPEESTGVRQKLTSGLSTYLRTPRLRGLLALSVAVSAAGAMVIVNTVVYVRDRLGGSETDTAVAFAAFGAGSMVVALLLPRLLDTRADRPFMVAGGALLGIGLLAGLLEPSLTGLLIVWMVLGIGSSLVQTPAGRLLRRSAHEGDRPKVYAAQFALSHGCWLLAYPLAGWLGNTLDLPVSFAVLAGIALVSTVVSTKLWSEPDALELVHDHAEMEHHHLHVHDEHHQHEHEGWEGPEPHSHPHRHAPIRHEHPFVIDRHHPVWPRG